MMVRIRLFAGMRQEIGVEVLELEMTQPATIADLRSEIARRFEQFAPLLLRARFAVDEQYVDDDQPISPDASVACIPPVSGG